MRELRSYLVVVLAQRIIPHAHMIRRKFRELLALLEQGERSASDEF